MKKRTEKRLKTLVSTGIMTLIIILIAMFLSSQISTYNYERFARETDESLEEIALDVEKWMDEQLQIAKKVAKDESVIYAVKNATDKSAAAAASKYVKKINRDYRDIQDITAGTKFAKTIYSTNKERNMHAINSEVLFDSVDGELVGSMIPTNKHLDSIYKGKDHIISAVRNSTTSKSPIIGFLVPIVEKNRIIGHVNIDVKMNNFLESQLTHLNEKGPGEYFLVEQTGNVLMKDVYYKSFASYNFNVDFEHDINKIISGNNFVEEKISGIDRIVISKKIENTGLNVDKTMYVAIVVDKNDIIEAWFTIPEIIGLLVFILIASIVKIILTKKSE